MSSSLDGNTLEASVWHDKLLWPGDVFPVCRIGERPGTRISSLSPTEHTYLSSSSFNSSWPLNYLVLERRSFKKVVGQKWVDLESWEGEKGVAILGSLICVIFLIFSCPILNVPVKRSENFAKHYGRKIILTVRCHKYFNMTYDFEKLSVIRSLCEMYRCS